jgi:hypothetical protein
MMDVQNWNNLVQKTNVNYYFCKYFLPFSKIYLCSKFSVLAKLSLLICIDNCYKLQCKCLCSKFYVLIKLSLLIGIESAVCCVCLITHWTFLLVSFSQHYQLDNVKFKTLHFIASGVMDGILAKKLWPANTSKQTLFMESCRQRFKWTFLAKQYKLLAKLVGWLKDIK